MVVLIDYGNENMMGSVASAYTPLDKPVRTFVSSRELTWAGEDVSKWIHQQFADVPVKVENLRSVFVQYTGSGREWPTLGPGHSTTRQYESAESADPILLRLRGTCLNGELCWATRGHGEGSWDANKQDKHRWIRSFALVRPSHAYSTLGMTSPPIKIGRAHV